MSNPASKEWMALRNAIGKLKEKRKQDFQAGQIRMSHIGIGKAAIIFRVTAYDSANGLRIHIIAHTRFLPAWIDMWKEVEEPGEGGIPADKMRFLEIDRSRVYTNHALVQAVFTTMDLLE
jgi:hypothetical protein